MWRFPQCWFWQIARPPEAFPRRPAAPRFRCLHPAEARVPPGARRVPWAVPRAPWAVPRVPWAVPEAPWAVRRVPWAVPEAPWVRPAGLAGRWGAPWALPAVLAVPWAVRRAPWGHQAVRGVRWDRKAAPRVRGVRWDRKAAPKARWVPWEAPAVRPAGLQADRAVPEVSRPVPQGSAVASEAGRGASPVAEEARTAPKARATSRESCVNPWRVTIAKLPVSAAPWRRPGRVPPPVPEARAE